ncbi:hypothetical protein [Spiroplasma endosymbiont of Sarcophaga variegata]|uniref:hypothetical protein n=1 Tax=Spiroplasma endosymbiont of Sarcophaga variegata TaxID=3066304 RepID=UPI003AF63431
MICCTSLTRCHDKIAKLDAENKRLIKKSREEFNHLVTAINDLKDGVVKLEEENDGLKTANDKLLKDKKELEQKVKELQG